MGETATPQDPPPGAGNPALGRSVSRSHLVNRLNYMNFQDQTILVSLKHLIYDDSIFLHARPQPCSGERLDCLWAENWSIRQILKTYRFDYLLIADGKKYLVVNTEATSIDETGLSLLLPAACREFQARKIRRHPAKETSAQLLQHGVLFDSSLIDFTPVSLRVSGMWERPETLQWINPEDTAHLKLFRGDTMLYSGVFEIQALQSTERWCSFVLKQHQNNIRRFKAKKYRNERQELVPSPSIVFDHPLIEKKGNLKLVDISGTGFCVEESEGDSVLMPGMMIPNLKISFAQGFSLTCLAQVLSRNVTGAEGGERTVRCGFAILDMEINEHVKLLSLLHQGAGRKSYVCTEVDLDDLWDFFFETGFIYPGKYLHFQEQKQSIKETYAKLYSGNPHIARHFIYLDRGAILGHLAMVRFYQNTWLIHHHAARKSASVKAGLAVLEQVSHYLSELESFAFSHLRYVFCYYRPENKFPARVFGGFAHLHADQASCSLDLFAYSHYRATGVDHPFPDPWVLAPSSDFDLTEAGRFYRHVSGGVLIDAFDLHPGAGNAALMEQYRSLGFRKEVYFYSLRKGGSLKAFFLVNCTDAGFNMAELTNCVTVMVVDEETPARLLELSLEKVSRHYEEQGMPVLTYPRRYVEKESLPLEKSYLLWVLDMQCSDQFLQYCDGLFMGRKKTH